MKGLQLDLMMAAGSERFFMRRALIPKIPRIQFQKVKTEFWKEQLYDHRAVGPTSTYPFPPWPSAGE